MDGNGRWAQQRGLPRSEGHRQGVQTVRQITSACVELQIEQLTLYCFSSENWKRPEIELNALMALLKFFVIQERSELQEKNIRLEIIGRRSGIPQDILEAMDETVRLCSQNSGLVLRLAINYGSRAEIVDAVRAIVHELDDPQIRAELLKNAGKANIDDLIDEDYFASHLYTGGFPDPDLLIRTAHEFRLSNYLLWQLSYAEIWISDVLWPDFDRAELLKAIDSFCQRDRRYGGLNGHSLSKKT